jgi:hypothetical protein
LTALLPPPPTPITLMIEDCSLGKSNCIISGNLMGGLLVYGYTIFKVYYRLLH